MKKYKPVSEPEGVSQSDWIERNIDKLKRPEG